MRTKVVAYIILAVLLVLYIGFISGYIVFRGRLKRRPYGRNSERYAGRMLLFSILSAVCAVIFCIVLLNLILS